MSAAGYPIPAGPARAELVVRGSRFVAEVSAAPTAETARAVVAATRAAHPGASHHVYAFVAGYGASVTEGMSDDGEPSGTAGPPVLAVLRGSGLGDAVVVVARYFGGTKLGTGGLVRAYGDVARAALEAVPRAVKVRRRRLVVRLAHGDFERARRLVAAAGGEVAAADFGADVGLEVVIAADASDDLADALRDLTAGRVEVGAGPDDGAG